jgi:hypothetical protein
MNPLFSTTNGLAGAIGAPVALFASIADSDWVASLAASAWESFPWEDRGAPRRECFLSELGLPYTYGSGMGTRTYWPKSAPAVMAELTKAAEDACGCRFELCFANGYAGEREHLGWHADDSPEIDDGRPIAVMSLGAAREIWVKPKGAGPETVEKILLPSGSLFVMGAGMQDTHVHRIPKNSAPCGPRVSLTWRGAA